MGTNERYHFFSTPRSGELPIRIRNIYRFPERITDKRWRDNLYQAFDSTCGATGELLIGSLESLLKLCEIGLPPRVDGKILMIDTLDMPFAAVQKLLRRLVAFCKLDDLAALAFSSIAERTDRPQPLFPELRNADLIRKFLDGVSGLISRQIPVFHGFPLGHCAYKLTVPIGVRATIVPENGDLLLEEAPFATKNSGHQV